MRNLLRVFRTRSIIIYMLVANIRTGCRECGQKHWYIKPCSAQCQAKEFTKVCTPIAPTLVFDGVGSFNYFKGRTYSQERLLGMLYAKCISEPVDEYFFVVEASTPKAHQCTHFMVNLFLPGISATRSFCARPPHMSVHLNFNSDRPGRFQCNPLGNHEGNLTIYKLWTCSGKVFGHPV